VGAASGRGSFVVSRTASGRPQGSASSTVEYVDDSEAIRAEVDGFVLPSARERTSTAIRGPRP
jgi:hypothetical protein